MSQSSVATGGLPLWLRFFRHIIIEMRPSMRDFFVALIAGIAALCLKAYDEQFSLAFSWTNLKNLLFPIVVALTFFVMLDVIRAARQLMREVKAESEQEINLYPSLVLTEKFTEKRAPSFYRLKIAGMSASLILVFLLACVLSWGVGGQPARAGQASMSDLGLSPSGSRFIELPLQHVTIIFGGNELSIAKRALSAEHPFHLRLSVFSLKVAPLQVHQFTQL